MRQSNQVPQIIETRIRHLAETLPSKFEDKTKIITKYAQFKGYQFLNPKSKLHKNFLHKHLHLTELRSKQFEMENQIMVKMQGGLEQLSVGAMCEVIKQNLRKGVTPYEPTIGEEYEQEVIFERDQQLFNKAANLLHTLNLTRLQKKNNLIGDASSEGGYSNAQKNVDKLAEFRKQMTVKQDGSLGVWGGKKYEGLGNYNQFTAFRRQKSLNYYQNTFNPSQERKKY